MEEHQERHMQSHRGELGQGAFKELKEVRCLLGDLSKQSKWVLKYSKKKVRPEKETQNMEQQQNSGVMRFVPPFKIHVEFHMYPTQLATFSVFLDL